MRRIVLASVSSSWLSSRGRSMIGGGFGVAPSRFLPEGVSQMKGGWRDANPFAALWLPVAV